MTRYVLDTTAVLHLAREQTPIPSAHSLLAPTLIRSQLLSVLHERVHRGDMDREAAEAHLEYFAGLKMRLLGDAVLREHAWKIADELGWAETYEAEYLALTRLQADAFVTLNEELAKTVAAIVPVAEIGALTETA